MTFWSQCFVVSKWKRLIAFCLVVSKWKCLIAFKNMLYNDGLNNRLHHHRNLGYFCPFTPVKLKLKSVTILSSFLRDRLIDGAPSSSVSSSQDVGRWELDLPAVCLPTRRALCPLPALDAWAWISDFRGRNISEWIADFLNNYFTSEQWVIINTSLWKVQRNSVLWLDYPNIYTKITV